MVQKERGKSNLCRLYLLGGGIASRHPRTTQQIKSAIHAERTTISHWPRTTTELSTGVRGTANAGTAFTNLNCLRTTLLSTRTRVCCGKSRCGREEESRLSRVRGNTFSSGCAPSAHALCGRAGTLPLADGVQCVSHLDCMRSMRALGERRNLEGGRTSGSIFRTLRVGPCEQRGNASKSNADRSCRSSGHVRSGPPNWWSSSGSWSKGWMNEAVTVKESVPLVSLNARFVGRASVPGLSGVVGLVAGPSTGSAS